jgi:hypothetical protein
MKAILFTILFAGLVGGSSAYFWLYYGGFAGEGSTGVAFIEIYGDYADVAKRVDVLVHVPGVADNPDRSELQSLLSTILVENITKDERERLSRIAFSHLDTVKKEIDQAQAAQAELYQVLQDLDTASKQFHGIEARGLADEIVQLARERAEQTARISSILSETNDHTYAIITKILGDGGELRPGHIQIINDSTTAAEERYDTLAELYDIHAKKRGELDARMQDFAKTVI